MDVCLVSVSPEGEGWLRVECDRHGWVGSTPFGPLAVRLAADHIDGLSLCTRVARDPGTAAIPA